MVSAVSDASRLGCNERNGAGTSTGISVETSAGTRVDADESKGVESKIDIITLDKTNKTSILVSY